MLSLVMNELQVRLSADITALQSALTKAKQTIKSFESETAKETEEGNVGFKRKIGLIESLTNKAKALRVALSQATDERKIEAYNQELEQTTAELTRLNALGRNVSQNLGGVGNGFQQVATKGANANGVAIEFNRIIQDAPFGIIGIGNNLQQLAGNFAQVSQSAGGTGAAIRASLGALVSPANLALLAISALTAGFTAYQMGAFDSVKETDFLKEAYDDLAESAESAAEKIAAVRFIRESINEEIDKILGLNSSFNIVTASAEQLSEIMNRAFAKLDRTQLDALQQTLENIANDQLRKIGNELGITRDQAIAFIQSVKDNTSAFESLSPKVRDAVNAYFQYSKQAESVNTQLEFYSDNTDKAERSTRSYRDSIKELQQEIITFSTDPLVDAYFKAIEAGAKFRASLANAASGLTGEEGEDPNKAIEEQIARTMDAMGMPVKEVAEEYVAETDKINTANSALIDSFSTLSAGISSSLNISNRAFRGFLTTVLTAAPKIISAIIAQSAAKKAADKKNIASNAQVAASEGIAVGAKAANALGPVGLALLPVFIGGALALISGAFSKIGGGGGISGGGGGGGSIGIPSQTFGNANQVPSQVNPDLSGFGSGFALGGGRLTTEVSGDSLIFVLEQAQEKRSRS